jgi:ABC-type multidrug transport system ATPase subunit
LKLSNLVLTRRDFSLRVDAVEVRTGDTVAVIGSNGSGKSTLLEVMLGMIGGATGSVSLEGRPVRAWMGDTRNRRRIGVQIQSERLRKYTTEGEHLAIHDAVYRKRCDPRVLDALDVFAIRGKRYETLSAGERQRCHLALALGHRPEFVFLDEPTAALDAHFRRNVVALIHAMQTERFGTIVLVTHDEEEVALAGQVLFAEAGRVSGGRRLDELVVDRLGACRCAVDFSSRSARDEFAGSGLATEAGMRAFFCGDRSWLGFGTRAQTESVVSRLQRNADVRAFSLGEVGLADLIGSASWRSA